MRSTLRKIKCTGATTFLKKIYINISKKNLKGNLLKFATRICGIMIKVPKKKKCIVGTNHYI